MWEVWTRQLPFEDMPAHGVGHPCHAVAEGKRPPSAGVGPAGYEALMEACWHADPAARPSFDACVQRLAVVRVGP